MMAWMTSTDLILPVGGGISTHTPALQLQQLLGSCVVGWNIVIAFEVSVL